MIPYLVIVGALGCFVVAAGLYLVLRARANEEPRELRGRYRDYDEKNK